MERIFAVPNPVPTVNILEAFAPAKSFPTIGAFVNVILKNAFVIAGVIFLVLLIFGGFSFIVSAGSGDAKKAEQSKQAITAAVTGLVLIFASYWIIQIIEIITGVTILPK
jgi:hypothetical protein